jgi:hypothetical protein
MFLARHECVAVTDCAGPHCAVTRIVREIVVV